MNNNLQNFILTFVPLFIVVDALGILPFVISMSEDMSRRERRKMINVATITATIVGLVFLFFGQLILRAMSISVGSFAIAGGIILLALSIKHMTTGRMMELIKEEMVAVVPIGTPLTVGPATITTLLLIFMVGEQIAHFLGQGGLKAVSRVFSLLLAAIAVTMIIHGLEMLNILTGK
ncbi:MAG: MarC family protein [Dehalococcoidia bacterium]